MFFTHNCNKRIHQSSTIFSLNLLIFYKICTVSKCKKIFKRKRLIMTLLIYNNKQNDYQFHFFFYPTNGIFQLFLFWSKCSHMSPSIVTKGVLYIFNKLHRSRQKIYNDALFIAKGKIVFFLFTWHACTIAFTQ